MVEIIFQGVSITLIGSLIIFIFSYIYKKRLQARLLRFYLLVDARYKEIDHNLTTGINQDKVNGMENDVSLYISMSKIKNHKLTFSKQFQTKFLKFCGVGRHLLTDTNTFFKYSRMPEEKTYLEIAWQIIWGNFYQFYPAYQKGEANPRKTWADVEMPIKMLRMYLKVDDNLVSLAPGSV